MLPAALVLGILSLHAAATIEEHPTCVIHTISRIHRLQEIGWLWIITGGSLASAVALEINSRLCLAKYIKRQRAGSSPHLADAGAESPVAGGGDGGAMRCSAALKVGFAATAFAGSLGYFVLLMYALGLSVVMADGACAQPLGNNHSRMLGVLPPTIPVVSFSLRGESSAVAGLRAAALGVAGVRAAHGRADGLLHLAPLARLQLGRREGAAVPDQVRRSSDPDSAAAGGGDQGRAEAAGGPAGVGRSCGRWCRGGERLSLPRLRAPVTASNSLTRRFRLARFA